MGLFESIFKKQAIERQVQGYFKTLTAYQPVFTSFEGGIYEMALTRAAIHAFATHCSKLKPEVNGPGNQVLERKLQYRPNPYMDTAKFLYRLATIYSVHNNAFIAPLLADDMETVTGYFPLLPQNTKIVTVEGFDEPFVRYSFLGGQSGCIELSRAGLLTQFQYRDDFFGADNMALNPTLQLINTQNQGIIEGVKNSATIRFMARLSQTFSPKTIKEERQRFMEDNLSAENNGGVMLVDQKYADVKQIDSQPWVVNPVQMKLITESVYSYFGVNEEILQNKFKSDSWSAYYEGKLEPFALQLSLVMTNMTFTEREVAFENEIIFTANRLQYATNAEKLSIVTQLFDRGFITHNEGLEVFNMAPVDGGDRRFIRREYIEVNKLNAQDALEPTTKLPVPLPPEADGTPPDDNEPGQPSDKTTTGTE
jgi:hypothetical protein